jgi:DNA-binding CsgD family transcriptional regulator
MPMVAREVQRHREEEVVRLTAKGMSATQIAERLGVHYRTVVRYRTRAGVAQPVRNPWTESELQRCESLLADGCSLAEVARTVRGHEGGNIYRHPRLRGKGWSNQQSIEHAVALRQLGAPKILK